MGHACVTGGSSGVGYEIVRVLLRESWQVTVIDKKECKDSRCVYIKHNFCYPLKQTIKCDLLVISHATFEGFKCFKEHSKEEIDKYIEVNLLSQVSLIRSFTFTHLVYMNSVLAFASFPGVSLYSGCKGFMHSLCGSLRREGVHVLTVYAYKINTPLFKSVRAPFVLSKEKVAEEVYRSFTRKDSFLYIPSVFRLSFLFSLLPLCVQDFLIRGIYKAMVYK